MLLRHLGRRKLVVLYATGMIILGALLEGKLSLPSAINVSVSSLMLYNGFRKQGIDLSALNYRQVTWLSYISSLDKPAGIVHNATDAVVWLNSRSCLKLGMKTTKSHIDNEKLIKIRNTIKQLDDVDVKDRQRSFLELSYVIRLKSPVQVTDRFYKLLIGTECFRIFECLEISDI